MSFGSLKKGVLDLRCGMSYATLVIPNSEVLTLLRGVELASLDLIKLSPRLPIQEDLDVWITIPGIKPAMDSSCQMQREYWMHSNAASSLAALERCYTLFLLLLTIQ